MVVTEIEVHSAIMFHCPECHAANFRPEISYDAAPDAMVPGTDIPYGGSVALPPCWYVCNSCGYLLTKQQEEVRAFELGGGVVLPAWFFSFDSCGRAAALQ